MDFRASYKPVFPKHILVILFLHTFHFSAVFLWWFFIEFHRSCVYLEIKCFSWVIYINEWKHVLNLRWKFISIYKLWRDLRHPKMVGGGTQYADMSLLNWPILLLSADKWKWVLQSVGRPRPLMGYRVLRIIITVQIKTCFKVLLDVW